MQNITLQAEPRDTATNGQLKTMRAQGWIPAVLYGKSASNKKKGTDQSILLKVPEKTFTKTFGRDTRANAIVEIKWGSESTNAVIKEIQKDFITDKLLHIDFLKIIMTEKLKVMVPIHVLGEAPGVKIGGGILELITRDVEVLCLPKDVPHAINADVTKLDLGHGLTVKDLTVIPGVEILTDENHLVVNIVAPAAVEEPTATGVTTETTEPEVITKGKKLEEGEEGAEPAAGDKAAAKPAAKPPTK